MKGKENRKVVNDESGKSEVLYIASTSDKIGDLELNGFGVVKYKNGRLEKVIDGFSHEIYALVLGDE